MNDSFVLDKINELCIKEGWSHYELAKRANIPQSRLSNLFNRTNQPTISTLIRLCDALDITMSQFFSEDNKHLDLNTDQEEILNLWDSLPARNKEIAKAYLIGLSSQK